MKKFVFRPARVLDWRSAQARIEEANLERIYAERRAIDQRAQSLAQQQHEAQTALVAAKSVSAGDLAALDTFHRFATGEFIRLETMRFECDKRVAAQIGVVAAKRRDVRLLERLKEKEQASWTRQFDREMEAQAGESYLARWNREH
jgi:hypothetical protein